MWVGFGKEIEGFRLGDFEIIFEKNRMEVG